VPTDAPTPAEGARRYAATVRDFFGLADGEWPAFDLTLNGMGPDGHTASLFPHRSAVGETRRIAVMSHAGLAPWVDRVTLTLPVFNHARRVLFLAGGAAKADMLKQVLEGERNVKHWPAGGIDPEDGEAVWLLEPAVAAKLADAGSREPA
jgi:6-phosphogluconolactonase